MPAAKSGPAQSKMLRSRKSIPFAIHAYIRSIRPGDHEKMQIFCNLSFSFVTPVVHDYMNSIHRSLNN